MRRLQKLFVFICLYPACAFAQDKPVISGSIGLYADFYNMVADSSIPGRRPPTLLRLVASATVSYKDFSLPFVVNISPEQTSVITPVDKYKNFGQYLSNPLNQLSIAPKYKWVQLLLGTQIPHYSELTFGDLPVFGAGIKLTPGKFRFEFFGGTSQHAIEADTLNNIKGVYKRNVYSGKIGYGKEEASHVYLIAGYAIDDTNSLKIKPDSVNPENGLLLSLDYRLNLPGKFYLIGETAGSLFSRDVRSQVITDAPIIPQSLFATRYSTRADGADILTFGHDGKNFGFKASGKYYGDGYVPLGYPFMETDRLEITFAPRFSLFKNKLTFNGSAGEMVNNLTHTRGATSTSLIGFANVSAQVTKALNLSGNFSNFGFRNTVTNDTLKIQMVSLSYGFNPSYSVTIGNTIDLFSLSFSHDQFRDYNTISGSLNNNDANSGMLTYNLAFTDNPLTLTLLANKFDNILSSGTLSVNAIGITGGYGFMKNKIIMSLGETYTQSLVNGDNPTMQLTTLLSMRYKINKSLNFTLSGSVNAFNGGNLAPLNKYTENLLRTSLVYKF